MCAYRTQRKKKTMQFLITKYLFEKFFFENKQTNHQDQRPSQGQCLLSQDKAGIETVGWETLETVPNTQFMCKW